MLYIDLKRNEKEPAVLVTKDGERIEIRHCGGRGGSQIGIKIAADETVMIYGPHLVRKMGIDYKSKED